MSAADRAYDYDVVVVGSGFGGAVTALRLTEKGYRVAVLEAGRRFRRDELPQDSWDIRNYLWAPALGLYGVQRVHVLPDAVVLAGAGVGGGSLTYGNSLYVPPDAFFRNRQWGHITDWREELAPFYDQARRMLGVRANPAVEAADAHLKDAADKLGYGGTFRPAPVGVFFGDGRDADGTVPAAPGPPAPDPSLGGAGPSRHARSECGACLTGCRPGAKNTLNENYLHLAERGGAEIHPLTTVTAVRPLGDGFAVDGPHRPVPRHPLRRQRKWCIRARTAPAVRGLPVPQRHGPGRGFGAAGAAVGARRRLPERQRHRHGR